MKERKVLAGVVRGVGLTAVLLGVFAGVACDQETPAPPRGSSTPTAVSGTATAVASPSASSTPPASPVRTAGVTPTPTPASVPGPTITAGPGASPTPAATSPTPNAGEPSPQPLRTLEVERVFEFVGVPEPVFLSAVPGDPGRLALITQDGLVFMFPSQPEASGLELTQVLDISDQVLRGGTEEGLLGMALHPRYGENGRLFLYYSAPNPRRTVLSEFIVRPDGTANPEGERVILEVEQPYANHNGGMVGFGPDGHLYVGLGDGGSGGDPMGHGQDTSTLLGSILRIDVDGQGSGQAYAIPPDNPFASGGGAPEIWAYGLRNPWRFSWDRETGRMWAADVGQNRLEEVDIIVKGGNYGWNVLEGEDCFRPQDNCDRSGMIPPVTTYDHSKGCSITGGYVYRGTRLPSLFGAYIYGDFCSGRIWALQHDGTAVTEQILVNETDLRITSFGEGPNGEVYVLDQDGGIYRFAAP